MVTVTGISLQNQYNIFVKSIGLGYHTSLKEKKDAMENNGNMELIWFKRNAECMLLLFSFTIKLNILQKHNHNIQ